MGREGCKGEIYPGVIMGIKGFTWVLKRRFVTMDDPRSDCKDLAPWLRYNRRRERKSIWTWNEVGWMIERTKG